MICEIHQSYSVILPFTFQFAILLLDLSRHVRGPEENRTLHKNLARVPRQPWYMRAHWWNFLVRLENSIKPCVLSGGPNGIRTRTSDVTGRRL